MVSIKQVAHLQLDWTQPSWTKREYTLATNEQPVATLRFSSALGNAATAQSADGCWTFDRSGVLNRQTTIRPCNQEEQIGLFRDKTWGNGGTLVLEGRSYKLTTNVWMSRFEILDAEEQPLIRFHKGGVIRDNARVEIAAPQEPNIALLTLFGWYIILILEEEAGSAAASAAAVS